jgi:hypothetical protein
MIRAALPACAVAAAALAPLSASAGTVQLGFILDGSGSLTSSEWDIIRDGLSTAIGSLIPVGGATTYEISIVSFSSAALTTINVNSFVVDSLAARSSLAATILTLPYQNGPATNYTSAFNAMRTALTDGVGTAGFVTAATAQASYVNFATDGDQNQDTALFPAARANLISAGVDNISIEGIGVSASAANFMRTSVCHPLPCDSTSPYDFPTAGFYIGVANATEYSAAIGNKIRTVTGTVPEPGSLALVGLALAGLGFAHRRNQAAKKA